MIQQVLYDVCQRKEVDIVFSGIFIYSSISLVTKKNEYEKKGKESIHRINIFT